MTCFDVNNGRCIIHLLLIVLYDLDGLSWWPWWQKIDNYCVHLYALLIFDHTFLDSDKDTAFRSSLSRVNTVRRPVSSTPHSKSEGSNHSPTGQKNPHNMFYVHIVKSFICFVDFLKLTGSLRWNFTIRFYWIHYNCMDFTPGIHKIYKCWTRNCFYWTFSYYSL